MNECREIMNETSVKPIGGGKTKAATHRIGGRQAIATKITAGMRRIVMNGIGGVLMSTIETAVHR